MASVSARPLADTIRAKADQDGIKFFFAQFVDMNAKPSAKLVPIENWDALVTEGAGFAGFAAGPIGQTPASPDMLAIPDRASHPPVRSSRVWPGLPVTSRSRVRSGRTARARS